MEILAVKRPVDTVEEFDKYIVALETKIKKEREEGVKHSFTNTIYLRNVKQQPVLQIVFVNLAEDEDFAEAAKSYRDSWLATGGMLNMVGTTILVDPMRAFMRDRAFPIDLPKDATGVNMRGFIKWAAQLSKDIDSHPTLPVPFVYAHQTAYTLTYHSPSNPQDVREWSVAMRKHIDEIVDRVVVHVTVGKDGEEVRKEEKIYRYKTRPTGIMDGFYVETPIKLHVSSRK